MRKRLSLPARRRDLRRGRPPEELWPGFTGSDLDALERIFRLDRRNLANVLRENGFRLCSRAFARGRRVTTEGLAIWIAPLEYVVLRKLTNYRNSRSDRHLRDGAMMLCISGDLVERSELAVWIEGPNLRGPLEEAERYRGGLVNLTFSGRAAATSGSERCSGFRRRRESRGSAGGDDTFRATPPRVVSTLTRGRET